MSEQLENVDQSLIEPTAVIPGVARRGSHTVAGDNSGRTADYDAYMRDLEERKARSAAFEAKRQANKPQEPKVELSAVDAVLSALEAAADEFEGPNGYGKPTFYVHRSIVNPGQIPSVEDLQKQLQIVGERLTALREHLAGQTESE